MVAAVTTISFGSIGNMTLCSQNTNAAAAPAYRLSWDKSAFSNPQVSMRYQSLITLALEEWSAAITPVLSSSLFTNTPTVERQILLDGIYASWTYLVHTALCCSVPVKSVGPHSKSWWDPSLQALIDRRGAAYAALSKYSLSFQNLESLPLLGADPTWQELWSTYADLRKQAHALVQSNKAEKWRKLVSKLQSEFDSDKRHFFATVQRLRSSASPSALFPNPFPAGPCRVYCCWSSRPSHFGPSRD